MKLFYVDAKILGASLRTRVAFAASLAKLLREACQEGRLSSFYFAVNMLLFQWESIMEKDMGVKVREAGSLTEAKELVMMIEPSSTWLFRMMIEPSSTWLFRKKASVRWVHRSRRSPERTRRQIKRRLLADALGKDGCLRYVEVKPSIFLEDVLEISQDFEHHAHLGFDVTVISISERRRPVGTLQAYVPQREGWSN
jgi:hypothetical protein